MERTEREGGERVRGRESERESGKGERSREQKVFVYTDEIHSSTEYTVSRKSHSRSRIHCTQTYTIHPWCPFVLVLCGGGVTRVLYHPHKHVFSCIQLHMTPTPVPLIIHPIPSPFSSCLHLQSQSGSRSPMSYLVRACVQPRPGWEPAVG